MQQCQWLGCQLGWVHSDLTNHVVEHAACVERNRLVCLWQGCQRADKPFQHPYQLQQHAALHANERQFACQQCDKRFNAEIYLRRHLGSHTTDQRPHKCTICGRNFSHSADKSRCERTHRGQLHACRYCDKTFKDAGNLRKHRKRWHINEAPVPAATTSPPSVSQPERPSPHPPLSLIPKENAIQLEKTPSHSQPLVSQPLGLPSPLALPSTVESPAPAPSPPQATVYSCVLPPISSFSQPVLYTLSKDGALDLTLGIQQYFPPGSYLGERVQPLLCGALDLTQSAHCDASLCYDLDQLCPDLEAGPGRPVDLSLPRLEYYS